jgi:hypothetical protein
MCFITVIWNQNTKNSSIIVDSINTVSVNYTLEHVIIAYADMKVVHQRQIPQVSHSFGYVCLADKCNDEITLKRLLRSLVIEEKFAQELIPLLQIVSPFDAQSAACYDFNNSTDDCPSTDLGTCQRCLIFVDR